MTTTVTAPVAPIVLPDPLEVLVVPALVITTGGGMGKALVMEIDARRWYIEEIEVFEPARGHGLGTYLLGAVCAHADANRRELHVLPLAEAEADTAHLRAWYERFGFVARTADERGLVGMVRPAARKARGGRGGGR